ncbi:MAG: guanylate kinase [Bacilli bacterium]|nr:guanylate kinase [Bacilli bacterium]
MEKRGLLIILSGPSGVGKGTVRKAILQDPSVRFYYSISMTTRSPRAGEVDGKDYYFVSREEFEKNIRNGNLLEYAEFVGNYYGSPKDKIESHRNAGEDVLLEIEVQGTQKVVAQCPDAITIFLIPPSMEKLEARIRGRSTETEEIIQRRLAKAQSELALKDKYKYVVVNDTVEQAAKDIIAIIHAAKAEK